MLAYVIRRILATIPVMAVVALFVFSLLYIAPGDPAAVIAGDQATPADVERIRQSLGLDRPFLVQFGDWVWNIVHANLGTSMFTGLPVTKMIAQPLAVPATQAQPRPDSRRRRTRPRSLRRPR